MESQNSAPAKDRNMVCLCYDGYYYFLKETEPSPSSLKKPSPNLLLQTTKAHFSLGTPELWTGVLKDSSWMSMQLLKLER